MGRERGSGPCPSSRRRALAGAGVVVGMVAAGPAPAQDAPAVRERRAVLQVAATVAPRTCGSGGAEAGCVVVVRTVRVDGARSTPVPAITWTTDTFPWGASGMSAADGTLVVITHVY